MTHLYLDLDGPLLDVSERYHRVYSDIVRQEGGVPLEKEAYWTSRRNGLANIRMISDVDPGRFRSEWMKLIESDEYIGLDTLQPGARSFLNSVRGSFQVYLVTLRSCSDQLSRQLDNLGLASYFDLILSAPGEGTDRWMTKVRLIQEAGIQTNQPSLFIGDTLTDIRAGQILGSRTIAMASGISSREILLQTQSDYLCDTIEEVVARNLLDELPAHRA